MIMKITKKWITRFAACSAAGLAIGLLLAAYLIPTELHANYIPKATVYENDPLSEKDFEVYTTSRLGREKKVEDYSINHEFAQGNGVVKVSSENPDLTCKVDLQMVPIVSSSITYNDICYEDHMADYEPDVAEILYYEDGTMETVAENQMNVTCEEDEEDHELTITAAGTHDVYQENVDIITVKSITTKKKVSTEKALTAKKLDLTINYSDGTSVKAKKNDITSDKIKHPKEGVNKLKCYYNDKAYIVKVKAYTPKPKVSFDGYGTFELEYSAPYDVGVARLNTFDGVTYFNGHRETYYSQNTLPGTALYIPGRHVADDGTIRDGTGYICAAADPSFHSRYDVILTSLGPAKIYDSGCPYGTIDIYVDW